MNEYNHAGDRVCHGEYKVPGGKLIVIDLAVRDGLLTGVQLSGDFFMEPPDALDAINQALEGLPARTEPGHYESTVDSALDSGVALYGITVEGIGIVIQRALS